MDRIISSLLLASGIYGTKTKDLNLHLLTHPEYPSLRSITDTLDYFNISNIAVKVDKTSLSQLPKMFLAHVKGESHMDFALVRQRKNNVKLTWPDGNSNHMSIEKFNEKWNGTILAVEKDNLQNTSLVQKFTNSDIFTILSIISILLLLWFYSPSLSSLSFSFLSLLGMIISYFIQKENFGIGDSIVAKVCSAINDNSEGCESVIKSDRSKVFGISLGDISLVYFTFLLIIAQFQGIDNYIFYGISTLTLAAVGYTLYIQIFDLKKWCLLCLGVSLILVGQFLTLQFLIEQSYNSSNFIAIGSILMMLVISSWIVLKTLWQNSIEMFKAKSELLGFKKNRDFFFHALGKNKKTFSNKINDKYKVSFGAEHPTVELMAITNPTCGFCNKAFEAYDYLLAKFPEDIRIDFVFNVSPDTDNNSNIIASRIIETYQKNKLEAYEMMQNWFKKREVDEWIGKYGYPDKDNPYHQNCILYHNEWSKINGMIYTPETILNGAIFPKSNYEIEDMEFFIETMKEANHLMNKSKLPVSEEME